MKLSYLLIVTDSVTGAPVMVRLCYSLYLIVLWRKFAEKQHLPVSLSVLNKKPTNLPQEAKPALNRRSRPWRDPRAALGAVAKFITPAQWERMSENHHRGEAAANDDADEKHDPFPVVKLHLADTNCVWLLTEVFVTNDEEHMAFGLADLGFGGPELGYINLDEMAELDKPGMQVSQDRQWTPTKTIGAYAREARIIGAISP